MQVCSHALSGNVAEPIWPNPCTPHRVLECQNNVEADHRLWTQKVPNLHVWTTNGVGGCEFESHQLSLGFSSKRRRISIILPNSHPMRIKHNSFIEREEEAGPARMQMDIKWLLVCPPLGTYNCALPWQVITLVHVHVPVLCGWLTQFVMSKYALTTWNDIKSEANYELGSFLFTAL